MPSFHKTLSAAETRPRTKAAASTAKSGDFFLICFPRLSAILPRRASSLPHTFLDLLSSHGWHSEWRAIATLQHSFGLRVVAESAPGGIEIGRTARRERGE